MSCMDTNTREMSSCQVVLRNGLLTCRLIAITTTLQNRPVVKLTLKQNVVDITLQAKLDPPRLLFEDSSLR